MSEVNVNEVYDDEAIAAAEAEAKKAAIESDMNKPFEEDVLLEVRHLRKSFPVQKNLLGKVEKELVAVDDVSFTLKAGETLGIVGESGCGKTTIKADLLEYESEVNAWNFHYKWNQHEYDSMVSFCYNNGVGGFRNLIKNGTRTKEEIADKMLLYVTDGYNELPGLVTRRERERALFLLPCDEEPEDDYVYVMDVVKAIWDGKFGNDEERKERLYEYFQDKVNKFVR